MSRKNKSEKPYEELVDRIRKIYNIGSASEILSWDQQVMMPDAGTFTRSRQFSTLSSLRHELLTDEKTGKLLDKIEEENISEPKQSVVRETRRKYERATSVPRELIEEISKTSSEAFTEWKKAKKENDFSIFQPYLEKITDLKRQYALEIDPDAPIYQTLFEDYEPYLGLDKAEEVLSEIKNELVTFLKEINISDLDISNDLTSSEYSTEKQEKFVREILDDLGYDWERGRLDTAPHPFTTGSPYDVRITTNYSESFLPGLLSTVHEFGHASYTLGLPRDEEKYGTPLAEAREMTIHESQSRLWENHVGRSRPFMEYLLPKLKDSFSLDDVGIEDVYRMVNQIKEENLIRTEADEVTYHLHIFLRYKIEKDLTRENIEIGDIPTIWNDKMEEYLGIRPESDSKGCLQDVHWSNGYLGYFPTYSLGSVLSAQIYDKIESEIGGLDEKIRQGEFMKLRNWLEENIHQHGKRYKTSELIQKITGQELSSDHFINYIKNKYRKVYQS